MGHIIQLPPFPDAYPEATAALSRAECTLLVALRWWVADHKQGEDPLLRLCTALDIAGAEDAAFSLDRFMLVVARSAWRKIAMACPRCPRLGEDERTFLYAANLAQNGQSDAAAQVLQNAFLTTDGAVLALGRLEAIGDQFATAKLTFCRRRRPAVALNPPSRLQAWSPADTRPH